MSEPVKNVYRITPLNEEEKKYLAEELLERLKDIFFMQSEKQVKQLIENLTFNEDDNVDFGYNINILGADILQIIGRKRRQQDSVPRETYLKSAREINK